MEITRGGVSATDGRFENLHKSWGDIPGAMTTKFGHQSMRYTKKGRNPCFECEISGLVYNLGDNYDISRKSVNVEPRAYSFKREQIW